jgi:hypothetical protein
MLSSKEKQNLQATISSRQVSLVLALNYAGKAM